MSVVGVSSICHSPPSFGRLPSIGCGGAVVGDGGHHQDHVRVAARQRLALEIGSRRGRDDLDAVRRLDGDVRGEQRHAGAAPARLAGEREAHPPRGAVADEAHRVDRLAGPSRGDEDVLVLERARLPEHRLGPGDDLLRLGHAADADLALGELAARRPDDLDAAREQQLVVRARRRVLPHPRVHGGRDEDRAVVREHGLGEHVVGQPVGEPRHRVRRQRRDDEQIGALEMRIRIGGSRRARERVERLGGDEPLGPARRQRQHVMAGANEQADDLARLVGRDAAGDAKDDARHRP